MSIRRKLFTAMASFILAMGVVFALTTHFVVRGILNVMLEVDRTDEIAAISGMLEQYYRDNGGSWDGVAQLSVLGRLETARPDAGVVLLDPERRTLYADGPVDRDEMIGLGVRSPVRINGETVATLHYYDREVGNLSKIRLGVTSSVTFLLFACAVVFVLISLTVAYRLSKKLTKPLDTLIPAIDRLKEGQFGVQVPVVSKDEFGTVAATFNDMSVRLKTAEQLRSNMVADVAHELRTPLTILRGHLDLMQQNGRPVEPVELLPIQDELIRLTRLVDDLHQLSLAEANKLPLERESTDMAGLLQRIVDRMAPDADGKGITIHLECRTGRTTAYVDPYRMMQVFFNLVVNAVKYTPSGGFVRIALRDDDRETAQAPSTDRKAGKAVLIDADRKPSDLLTITVTDTGPGIEPEHLPHIFERFYRTDEARARNRGGAGLGLAIAKQFVLAHNGDIEAQSRPGEGTTFIVRLPRH